MLKKMRVISSLLLSVVMLMLLMLRALPHHHHITHIPESGAIVETLHFGSEACEDCCEHSHDEREKCPIEHICCIVKACDELDYYKYTQKYNFAPAIIPINDELCLSLDNQVHAPPFFNPKIPDCRATLLSLRAPPHTVC